MLGCELKKLLRRGGWLLVAGLLLAEALAQLFTVPYDQELESNRAAYDWYMAQVEGPLTAEKRRYLDEEMARLELNRVRMENLKSDFYEDKISEAEFHEKFEEYAPVEAVYAGFTKLFAQYIFVREDPARYFLYPGGWEVLLTDWKPDLLLLLVLVILLTPVFCEEYACGMDQLLLTQKVSAPWAVSAKVAAAMLVTASLTAILQLCDLAYSALVFGIPHGDYSLCSLMSFGGTTGNLTLWQAFWLQFGLKELGYLYAATLILFLSVLLKKVSLTMMAGITLLILPHLAVQSVEKLLALPGPWALAVGSVYLQSDPAQALISAVALWSVGIILGMLLVIQIRNANHQLRWKPLLLLGCTALLLTGCGEKTEPQICFNSVSARTYETDRYRVEMHCSEGEENPGFVLLDKATEERIPFPLDALEGQTVSCGWNFYGEGDDLYYIKTTTAYTTPLADAYCASYDALMKLNLNTLEEEILYRWNGDPTWFFGLLDRPSWEPQVNQMLFLHKGKLYYDDNGTVCRMDLAIGTWEVFSENRGSVDVAYDGTYFYFLDSYNRLNRQDLNTDEIQVVENVVADKFLLTPKGVFFLNKQDGKTLYLWEPDSGNTRKICDITAMYMKWQDGALHLTTWEGQEYYLGIDFSLQQG